MAALQSDKRHTQTELVISVVLYQPDLPKLEQCLRSVLASTLAVKVYLVDHSPEPLAADWLTRFHDKNECLNYRFNPANPGFGAGHNSVMIAEQDAKMPYHLVLNPDAYFDGDLLQTLKKRMDSDPRIGLCIPQVCNPDGSFQFVNKRLPDPIQLFGRPLLAGLWPLCRALLSPLFQPSLDHFMMKDMDLTRPLVCPFTSGCFMFMRTRMLQEIGGFDERYFLYMEDMDMARRARAWGLNVVFSDLACFHHWERAAYKNRKLLKTMVRSAVTYFNTWGWVWDTARRRMNREVFYYEQS